MINDSVNLETILIIARSLKEMLQKFVFVGGSVLALYVDESLSDEARPTSDIDLTIELTGYADWVNLQSKLTELGYSPNPFGHAICNYLYQGISVDIMPYEDGPIGASNKWYKPGFHHLIEVKIEDVAINMLTAPYFLATKFEAFNGRGKDHRTSHDFEDIVFILDNRMSLVQEIITSDDIVQNFLKQELRKLNENPYLEEIIKSHLSFLTVEERFPLIINKIKQIID